MPSVGGVLYEYDCVYVTYAMIVITDVYDF